MKRVQYHPRAVKALTRYRNDAARITSKILAYAANPESQANNVKRLKGSAGVYRLRVGDYRVVFSQSADEIVVTKIEPRGSVYD